MVNNNTEMAGGVRAAGEVERSENDTETGGAGEGEGNGFVDFEDMEHSAQSSLSAIEDQAEVRLTPGGVRFIFRLLSRCL
jgi:hypothetical protein